MRRADATNEIKSRVSCLDYLKPSKGRLYQCPFCGSGTHGGAGSDGALEYFPDSNRFKCHACGEHGTVIDLFMRERGIDDFARAVDEMAAGLNITIDRGHRSTAAEDFTDLDTAEPTPLKAREAEAATEAATEALEPPTNHADYLRRAVKNLAESADAQAYLKGRGISMETAQKCCIGFDPAWISPTVSKRMEAEGKSWRPDPKPVIIIPSTVYHYVARDIRSNLDATARKYSKMNEGQPAIMGEPVLYSGAEHVFVVEGAFDALSIIEAGEQAIALNSTANADKLIKRLAKKPTDSTLILCLDNDEAGKRATERLKSGLQRLNISYVTADICGGYKDPNESLQADREGFIKAITQAVHNTAARPDNTLAYLDNLMAGEIEQFKQARDRVTGFSNLDEKAGGLNAGLYVLAAVTSLGKTSWALQCADQLAAGGQEVLFFSMEQSRLELVSKSLARMTAQADLKTAVNSLSIRRGYLPGNVLQAVRAYKEQIGERLSIIEGNFNADIGFIGDYVRRYVQQTGTQPICFIDYLQILQPAADGKSKGSKKDEIDMSVTELKRLSRELNITIIVISSVNRMNYLTPIDFTSLKESGGIEFTADVVWGLQLACLDEPLFTGDEKSKISEKRARVNAAKAETPRKLKFVCLKNRYGISNFDCYFDYFPANDLFVPMAEKEPRQQRKKW